MKQNRSDSPDERHAAELELCSAIAGLKKPAAIQSFLKDLCTPAELQALVDRWQVVGLLVDGHPYRKINEMTGVSVTTIGRVSRFLNEGFGGYRLAICKRK